MARLIIGYTIFRVGSDRFYPAATPLLFRVELAFFRQQRCSFRGANMTKTTNEQPVPADTVLKIAKEISVKFIEVGRLTPATFDATFKSIYRTIEETVASDD